MHLTGRIFQIQRYSTHDGPGIRTTVFLKGCPLRCFWCHNPESQIVQPVLLFTDSQCSGCGLCEARCPQKACRIVDGVAVIDRERCTACGQCVDFCLNRCRSLYGREASVEEIMHEVLRDRPFYESSGGGVTFSGGEPLLQAELLLELLRQAKENDVSTAVETCAYVDWSAFELVKRYVDLWFCDIKSVDSDKHKRGTGVENNRILDNIGRLVRGGASVCIRMPLIPGYNDAPEDVCALGDYVRDHLGLGYENIELLKYNNLGESKHRRMGEQDIRSLSPQSEDYLKMLDGVLRECFG